MRKYRRTEALLRHLVPKSGRAASRETRKVCRRERARNEMVRTMLGSSKLCRIHILHPVSCDLMKPSKRRTEWWADDGALALGRIVVG